MNYLTTYLETGINQCRLEIEKSERATSGKSAGSHYRALTEVRKRAFEEILKEVKKQEVKG